MKRFVIVLAGALTATSGVSLAAMNATGEHYGLPQGWTMTAGQGYGALVVANGNPGSAMCVECHSVNPSRRILDVEQGGTGLTVTAATAAHQGSHFVMNQQAGAANAPWGTTNTGGGFTGGFGGAARDGGQYLRGAAWASGAVSKFNTGTALASINEGASGWATTNADMICESCHNIVRNTANAATDNDLLVGVYQDNVNDSICTGCHASTHSEDPVAGRLAFHNNDNLPAFGGTGTRKRHHVMTGDTYVLANYNSAGANSSVMWAPSFSDRLHANWCASPYTTQGSGLVNLVDGAGISFRNACNVAGSGSRANTAVAALGDITPTGGVNVNCVNCHRPHNAMSASGAMIFRMGDTSKSDFPGLVGGKFAGLTNASVYYGIRRQSDVDTNYVNKVYGEYRPLCAGCHYGY